MTAENNGGKTNYYDLPRPDSRLVRKFIENFKKDIIDISEAVTGIYEVFPQTLNDIIEAKNMQPWQHEVMKACYAIDARAEKNGGSKIREINKIIYYAQRGLVLAEKERE